MKRVIIKTLSLSLAVIFILLTLLSCDPTTDQGEQNGGNNNTNGGSSSTSHYYGVKTVYSYDDVMDALAIVRQRRTVKPTYTVKDMGEDYTIFYQFYKPHYNRPYPIDYDVFFNTYSSGLFYTYIFLENQTCSGETHPGIVHASDLFAYKEDEDYEKLRKYMKEKACIRITKPYSLSDDFCDEIVFIENLSYYASSNVDKFEYFVCLYGGIEIMHLESCVELDDAFFKLLFENLVTTSVKE